MGSENARTPPRTPAPLPAAPDTINENELNDIEESNLPAREQDDPARSLKEELHYREPLLKLQLENADLKQNIEMRREHANSIKLIITCFLGCVAAIIWLTADGLFHLSDTVLVTILSTTTVNVLGLYFIVARYLFPRP